jgi:DNA-binding SARP family transcriptional activator
VVWIQLLGPVQAQAGRRTVNIGPPQTRLVLSVLALEVNRLVPVDRLVELIWPESPPRTAEHAVQVGVSRLRRMLGDTELVRQGSGYLLRTDPMSVDAHRFTALVKRSGEEVDDRSRVALLDEALALWSGPAMAGTGAADGVVRRLCRGLEEIRLAALEERIEACLRRGGHPEVLGELSTLVGEYPLRERLVGQLMRTLYRCGRSADALLAYQRIRRSMADELGIDPGTELRQLELAILRNDPALDPPVPRLRRAVGHLRSNYLRRYLALPTYH